jgi:O-antigen/teichoic acid export membrane protein
MTDDSTGGDVGSRTAIGATWLIAWRMITRALGLVSTLVLARILVPRDFGLIAMATTFTAAIDSLSEVGLQDALVRRLVADRRMYDTAFTMQALRSLLTAGVIVLGAPVASTWFSEPRLLPILLLLAALAAASGLENIGIVEFRRTLQFSMEFKLLFIPRIAQFLVTITAAWLLRSYWALIIGIAVSKLSRLAMTYLVHPHRSRLTLREWRELAGFSFWTWASSLASLVWERSDPFILGRAVGAADLGVYLLAAEIAVLPITELVAPASRALFAGVSMAQNQGRDTVALAPLVVSAMLLIVVPLTIGVSATSGYLTAALLGSKWAAAQPLIAIFAWLCVFSPFSWVCTTVLVAHGQVRRNFYATAAAAAVKACVLYAASLTRRMDVIALAAVACVGVESLLFAVQLGRVGNPPWREVAGGLLRIVAAAGITAAMLYGSGLGWQPVSMSTRAALAHGGLTGIATLLGYGLFQLVFWRLTGRPSGPETRLLDLAAELKLPWPAEALLRALRGPPLRSALRRS